MISQKPQKRVYSIKEAAVYLSLSKLKVRGLTGEGALPYIRIGKQILIAVEDLEALILNNKEGGDGKRL